MYKDNIDITGTLLPTRTAGQYLTWTRYGNANGFAWAIVATLMFKPDGQLVDWCVYMGGCDLTEHELDAICWIARNGNAMGLQDARHFFPKLPAEQYRS